MKKIYIVPAINVCAIEMEQSVLIEFSQVDNDGDGKTDQRPIPEGDPEGGIGAKQGFPFTTGDEDKFYENTL